VYVPEELVGEVRRGVDNGRALQDLLVQAGPRYVKALKRRAGERREAQEELSHGASSGAARCFLPEAQKV
jgi:hypothetical protein